MGYQTIEVRKLTPCIGAELSSADPAKPLGNQTFQETHDALLELTHDGTSRSFAPGRA